MMQRVVDIAELGEWKPEINRLPEVKPHPLYLDQFHFGGITCSLDELQQHIQNCQLAVATQQKRSTQPVGNESGL